MWMCLPLLGPAELDSRLCVGRGAAGATNSIYLLIHFLSSEKDSQPDESGEGSKEVKKKKLKKKVNKRALAHQ